MHKKVLNPQVLLELICYVVFAVLIAYLLLTGRYQSYVTPKMIPYFYFTIAVMLIWSVVACFRLFRPQYKTRAAHCLVLAAPIILLLLPHTPINTAELSSRYMNANAFAGVPGQSAYSQTQEPASGASAAPQGSTLPDGSDDISEINIVTPGPSVNDSAPSDALASDNSAAAGPTAQVSPDGAGGQQSGAQPAEQVGVQESPPIDASGIPPGLDAVNKKIVVSNDAYGAWLYELYVNMDRYVGYRIFMTGFVFKDPAFMKDNEFVPARLMMSCCVADVSPCGLLCQYDKASELKADTWVTVEGTLRKAEMSYDGQTYEDIQIAVTKITPADKVEGYVYLN